MLFLKINNNDNDWERNISSDNDNMLFKKNIYINYIYITFPTL